MDKQSWFVVTGQGNYVLGVYGAALRDMAEAYAERVLSETGFGASIRKVSGERPYVGQKFALAG